MNRVYAFSEIRLEISFEISNGCESESGNRSIGAEYYKEFHSEVAQNESKPKTKRNSIRDIFNVASSRHPIS